MARDTLTKLRNLLSMKSSLVEAFRNDLHLAQDLVEALRADLAHAVSLIQAKDEQIQRLQDENYRLMMKSWEQQDKDEEWLADYLANHNPIEDTVIASQILTKEDIKDIMTTNVDDDYPAFGDERQPLHTSTTDVEDDGFITVYPHLHDEEEA